jgi:hypothetical protein
MSEMSDAQFHKHLKRMCVAVATCLWREADKTKLADDGEFMIVAMTLTKLMAAHLATRASDQEHLDKIMTIAFSELRHDTLSAWASLA